MSLDTLSSFDCLLCVNYFFILFLGVSFFFDDFGKFNLKGGLIFLRLFFRIEAS